MFWCEAVHPHTGAWLQLQWFSAQMDQVSGLAEESIALLELLPIVLACAVWGYRWKGMSVIVHCDNMEAVRSGYSKSPAMMHLLRCLFFIRALYQITLWAVHVPGIHNGVADAISRNHLAILFSQIPGAYRTPTPIPPTLLELLVVQRPDCTSHSRSQSFRRCFQPA